MSEDVRVEELRKLRPGHAPGADEVEVEWARARRVMDVIDRRKYLCRAEQKAGRRNEGDPEHARDELRNARPAVPASIERVYPDQQAGLHDRGRLRDQELDAEKERCRREVARVPAQEESPDVKTCEGNPRGAEKNRQEVDVGEKETAETER